MNIHLISFTAGGAKISEKISKKKIVFEDENVSFIQAFAGSFAGSFTVTGSDKILLKKAGTGDYVGKCFNKNEPVVIIGACGIAVRLIAPFVNNKLSDIPVIVIDEQGRYVIPVLSGHFGGANDLARKLGKAIKAECIITTATDLNDAFAADVFAKKNNMSINDKNMIAYVSSKILCKEKVTVRISKDIMFDKKKIPDALTLFTKDSGDVPDILITDDKKDDNGKLILMPKRYVLGIGCKKGTKASDIKKYVCSVLKTNGLSLDDVYLIASIDLKKDEPGLKELASENRIRFVTYSADELEKVRGDFSSSDFVKSKTGVDNVCERAAVKASGRGGELICGKLADSGITVAIAVRKVRLKFDA